MYVSHGSALTYCKLCEMVNKCTLHNLIVLAISVPKIIKVDVNLTKLWQKQFWLLQY